MKSVLFIAAEAVPFAKTGGMGDVVGSLPKELKRQGLDVRVIIPKYSDIPQGKQENLEYITNITVPVGWRAQYCGLFTCEHDGITYYFVDNEYYFKRSGIYGFHDDAERFSFFCRAVLELLECMDFKPDILHCHDWHAAMVPVLLRAHYGDKKYYSGLRTVLTIHNIEYQGVFEPDVLADLLGLEVAEYAAADKLGFYENVNFLKGGIAFADALTTVSTTYADEILTLEGGYGLDSLLRHRRESLTGILNGIDYEDYDPAADKTININYNTRSINRKKQNKAYLQEHLSLPVDPEIPLIGVVSRLVAAKGLDLIAEVLDELMTMPVQMVILGTGEEKYESMFRVAAHRHPAKLSVNIYFNDALARAVYAGSDMFLMPSRSEPCGIGQLIALRYGSVPIVRETGGLYDTIESFNEYTDEGNGFSFTHYDAQDMMYTIKRAADFYHDAKIWPRIVKAAMKSDFSWRRSASEYSALYDRL